MPDTSNMGIPPQTYAILREFLTAPAPSTQLELSKQSKSSPSQVSRIINKLIATGYAERQQDGRYRVLAAPAILTHLAFQRPMSKLTSNTLMIRATPHEAKEALVREGCTLAMDSALETYSAYFRSDRVCAYTTEAPRIMEGLRSSAGGLLKVQLYEPDLPLEGDVEGGHTTRFRTLFDLVCDGRAYAGKDLFEQLWGVHLA